MKNVERLSDGLLSVALILFSILVVAHATQVGMHTKFSSERAPAVVAVSK